MSSQPSRYFEDLRGLARSVRLIIPPSVLCTLRIVGAVGAAAVCCQIRNRWRNPDASFLVFAVAGAYLMLFNPRTQPSRGS